MTEADLLRSELTTRTAERDLILLMLTTTLEILCAYISDDEDKERKSYAVESVQEPIRTVASYLGTIEPILKTHAPGFELNIMTLVKEIAPQVPKHRNILELTAVGVRRFK
ncbi:MAG: hypothetical protein ACRCYY_17580 [Trueperaceae bacterium]